MKLPKSTIENYSTASINFFNSGEAAKLNTLHHKPLCYVSLQAYVSLLLLSIACLHHVLYCNHFGTYCEAIIVFISL